MSVDIFAHKIRVRPYNPDTDSAPLELAARQDGHGVAAPTHILEKNGMLVGYLSIGMVPNVLMWLDSANVAVKDTVDVVNFYENFCSAMGFQGFLLPVPECSPLKEYVQKNNLNYHAVCPNTMIYFKPCQPGAHLLMKKGGE